MALLTLPGATGGAYVPPPEFVAAVPLGGYINSVVGSTATVLTKPSGAMYLVMAADQNDFRVRVGDHSATGDNIMPALAQPAASISDGTSGWHIPAGTGLTLPAATVTVKGYGSPSVLTYYWV